MKKKWLFISIILSILFILSFIGWADNLEDKIFGLSYEKRIEFLKSIINKDIYPLWQVSYYLGDSYFHIGDKLGDSTEVLPKKKFYWENALNYFTRYMWEEKRRADTYKEKLLFSKSFLEVAKIYAYYSNVEKAFKLIYGAEKLNVLSKEEIDKVRNFAKTNLTKFKTKEEIERSLNVKYVPRGARRKIELLILFDYDSYTVKPVSYKQLNELAEILLSPEFKETNILIAGHADKRGTEEYNIKLSEKRALSVKNYLIGKGVDEYRLSIKGYGFSRPIDPRDTEEAYRLNRRVEFNIKE